MGRDMESGRGVQIKKSEVDQKEGGRVCLDLFPSNAGRNFLT